MKILKIDLRKIKKVPQKTKFDTRPKTKEYIHDNFHVISAEEVENYLKKVDDFGNNLF